MGEKIEIMLPTCHPKANTWTAKAVEILQSPCLLGRALIRLRVQHGKKKHALNLAADSEYNVMYDELMIS